MVMQTYENKYCDIDVQIRMENKNNYYLQTLYLLPWINGMLRVVSKASKYFISNNNL